MTDSRRVGEYGQQHPCRFDGANVSIVQVPHLVVLTMQQQQHDFLWLLCLDLIVCEPPVDPLLSPRRPPLLAPC